MQMLKKHYSNYISADLIKNLNKVVVIRNLSNLLYGIIGLVYLPYKYNKKEGLLFGIKQGLSNLTA